jgi:isoamylase
MNPTSAPGRIEGEWSDYRGLKIKPGKAYPFGAHLVRGGVQFSVFSRHASSVSLLLFDEPNDAEPSHEIVLDPKQFRTGDCWHVLVEGLGPGRLYLYRVDGPYTPAEGHRFNRNKLLLDPYAKALTGNFQWDLGESLGYLPGHPDADLSFSEREDAALLPKCIVVDDDFDWQGDRPLNYPLNKSVIYETHIRGLTSHPSAADRFGVRHPGTFRGIVEMIPYLKELGVTSLEFLPVAEFDEFEYEDRTNPVSGESLKNYWGYSTIAFFAPKGSYATANARGEQVAEFKTMVRELHRAGIEVILDIVFNHTGEGDHLGRTLSFKGLDNGIYYILAPDRRYYMNYSGCGNTLNCNHPVVREMIIGCLHYWVQEMHVDGFRFDLGSILGRGPDGEMMDNPPVLETIAQDPVLRDTKIIAEAWDAGGAYQVGQFPGGRWAEWNDRFRDDVRAFWRGEKGMASFFATRLSGSADLYLQTGRKPYHSVNYITAHDGFTLSDLVSYEIKHNEANGEKGQDGSEVNLSCNWGEEGETDDPAVLEIRRKMVRNFLATLLLSSGTPMILGGDEIRRTQGGNNNAYCHDNGISWYDFSRMNDYPGTYRFARLLIAFRNAHPALHRQEFFVGRDLSNNEVPDIGWFDENGGPMDWNRPDNVLALRIDGSRKEIHAEADDVDIIMFFNATGTAKEFLVPEPHEDQEWVRVIDTAEPSPADFLEVGQKVPVRAGDRYKVRELSMTVLIGVRIRRTETAQASVARGVS